MEVKFRLVSYNIHKCIGGVDRKYDPQRIHDTIAPYKPDLLLLQEVDEGAKRSEGHRQVDLLGDMLGLANRTYFPNVHLRSGGHYGNAILSRFPLTRTQNIDVTVSRTKVRSVLHGRFQLPENGTGRKELDVFNTHLGLLEGLRKAQLGKFLRDPVFSSSDPTAPMILAGDFNDLWGRVGKNYLEPAGFRSPTDPQSTFPAWAPVRPLDSIFVRGNVELQTLARSDLPVARWASDHRPIIADLGLV